MAGRNRELEREIRDSYARIRRDILSRIEQFKALRDGGSEEELFVELVFCLLTPGSKARSAWRALNELIDTGLLYTGTPDEISGHLNIVRFKNNKARRVVEARERFLAEGGPGLRDCLWRAAGRAPGRTACADPEGRPCPPDAVRAMREWLVEHVDGMGYKEASHFLRNVGFCEGISILDRHVLKNLHALRLIDRVPESLHRRRYLEIEGIMGAYAAGAGIPVSHLDFVLWYRETGEIFK